MGSLGEGDILSNLEIRDILDILGKLEKRDILDILDILEIRDFLDILDILEMGGLLSGFRFRDAMVSAWQAVLGSVEEEGDIIRLIFHYVFLFLVKFKVRFLSCDKSTFRLSAIHRLPLQIPESFCNLLYLNSSLVVCL